MNSEKKTSDDGNFKPTKMIEALTYIAENYNFGPKTTFYDENWLLRILLVLLQNKCELKGTDVPSLPFPERVKIYSKSELKTPFPQRYQGDKTGEGHIEVDGIIGQWNIIQGTKVLMELNKDFSYLTVFESKILSGLSPVRHKIWNQISRTIAGMIYSALTSETPLDKLPDLNFVLIYSSENTKLKLEIDKYSRTSIKSDISNRIALYKRGGSPKNQDFSVFEKNWENIFDKNIKIAYPTWESLLESIGIEELKCYYTKCLEYNRPPS
jgi:hypothetical protein